MINHLIVTADDYGAEEFIDEAIRKAIANGTVSSVSCFTTFKKRSETKKQSKYRGSVAAIKKLHKEFPHVGIGLHLNITTGFPLTDELKSITDRKGRFLQMHKYDFQKVNVSEAEVELEKQLTTFLDLGIPIDHISCHHGITGLFQDFWFITQKLGTFNGMTIPIRNPNLISNDKKFGKREGFKNSAMRRRGISTGLRLKSKNNWRVITSILMAQLQGEFGKKLKQWGLPTPDYFIDTFYGFPTQTRLHNIMTHGPTGDKVAEMVVHLGGTNKFHHNRLVNGMDPRYVKNFRPLEEKVFLSEEVSAFFKMNTNLRSYLKESIFPKGVGTDEVEDPTDIPT